MQSQQQNWQVYQDALRLSYAQWVAWVQRTELSHKKPSGRQDLFPGNRQKDESPVYLDVSAPSGFSTFFFFTSGFCLTDYFTTATIMHEEIFSISLLRNVRLFSFSTYWAMVWSPSSTPGNPSWVSQHSPVFEYHSCQNIALLITVWDSTYTLGRRYNCGETQ